MHLVERATLIQRIMPLAMQWGATLYSVCVSLGLSVLFARTMGPSAFGSYTYIYVLASFLALSQDGGFNTLLIRERVAKSSLLLTRNDDLPTIALTHLLGSTIILIAFAVMLAPWLGSLSLACAIFCFCVITLTQWLSSWLRGAGEFGLDAFFLFCGRNLSALMVLSAVLIFGATPVSIFVGWGIGLLLVLVGFHKHFPTFAKVSFKPPFWAYRSSVSFFAIGAASALYHQMDIVVLRHFLNDNPDVGHYAVASRMFDGILLLAFPVALMVFRRMRTQAMMSSLNVSFSFSALRMAFVIGGALAVMGWLLGPWGIGLLFGSDYAQGACGVIGWLFTALIFALPNVVLEQLAIATHRERWFAGCLAFAVLVSLGCNAWLVPGLGAQGAALATILTECLLFVSLSWGLRHELMQTVHSLKFKPVR